MGTTKTNGKLGLPKPEALKHPLIGRSSSIQKHLEALADGQLSSLAQLASLDSSKLLNEAEPVGATDKLGVEKYDIYDEYFEVERTSCNAADQLAAAFVCSLSEVGEEAKRGHHLDPLALNSFLRAVQVQARVLLNEAYHE